MRLGEGALTVVSGRTRALVADGWNVVVEFYVDDWLLVGDFELEQCLIPVAKVFEYDWHLGMVLAGVAQVDCFVDSLLYHIDGNFMFPRHDAVWDILTELGSILAIAIGAAGAGTATSRVELHDDIGNRLSTFRDSPCHWNNVWPVRPTSGEDTHESDGCDAKPIHRVVRFRPVR